jgi:hypothetical protein
MPSKLTRPPETWRPKRWRPEYEMIVALSSAGLSRQAVADKFFEISGTRYTTQHISNILNTPEGIECQKKAVEAIRGNFTETLTDKIERVSQKAVGMVEKLLDDEEKYENSPFNVIDRALSFMRITSKPAPTTAPTNNTQVNVNSSTMVMTAEAAKILRDGTDKADEVARLYGNADSGS